MNYVAESNPPQAENPAAQDSFLNRQLAAASSAAEQKDDDQKTAVVGASTATAA